jgi:hypothetical protein
MNRAVDHSKSLSDHRDPSFFQTPQISKAPLRRIGRETFSKAYVELDRATYLPRRYVLVMPDGKSTRDYRVTDGRCDQPVPEEVWRIPDHSDWGPTRDGKSQKIEALISRLIKPDLVP